MTHILVVDDSLLSRRMVVEALKSSGYKIIEAKNGVEALESFEKERPVLVVTDLLMPDMNGQQLLAHIRELDPTMPVIVASADIQQSTQSQCEELGISGFLSKPVRAQDLLTCIEAALTEEAGTSSHGTH